MLSPPKPGRFKAYKKKKFKPGNAKRTVDPLAHSKLLAYMEVHFEWMLMTGYTPATVCARRLVIRRFIAWCDERGLYQPADITKQVLERFQRYLFYHRKPDGRPLTLGTQKGHLAPLKLWFKWMARENHILYNPASELDLPRTEKRLPRNVLSISEVELILAEAEGDHPITLRDRAMMELLYSTALRRMEAANLAIYDIDFERRLVMVREGKGRKDRIVPIGKRALAWLDKYMVEARPLLLAFDHPAVFVTDYGAPASPDFVTARVKVYMKRANIERIGAAHLMRHACATHMLEGGADIRFLQALLGHASLETTEVYTHVAIDKLQAVHEATHPARLERAAADNPASPDDRQTLLAVLEAESEPESIPPELT